MKAMCFNKLTIVLITILSLFMGLVSCKEDEVDLTPNYISALIGKWEVTVDEISDSYIVTFSSDKTALVESYKNMTKKDGECTVKWDVVKGSIVFEDGKAWFAFGYSPVTIESIENNTIVGSQWYKESNVRMTRIAN